MSAIFLDDFLAKSVDPFTIPRSSCLSLGHIVSTLHTNGRLVATLMAFGQMATDNEITALKAAGVHFGRA